MPIDWDENDMSSNAAEQMEAAQAVAQAVMKEESPSPQPEPDDSLSEVEKRLELAQYYRLLLNDHLFGEMTSAAQTVEKEVRVFVRERLEVLLGIRAERVVQEPVKLPFSQEEVLALKTVASKVIGKPALLTEAPKPTPVLKPTPALRKAEPPPPAVSSTVEKRKPGRPALKKTEVPAELAEKEPAKKEAPAPVKQESKPASKKPASPAEDGSFEENGKRYKYVEVNGKRVKMNITPQARPKTAVPLPTPSKVQAESIFERQAQIENAEFTNPVVAAAVAASMQAGE